jgi:hypothetical protein
MAVITGRGRAPVHPQRDLYALAQAVVLSLAWLPAIWLLGGGDVVDWARDKAWPAAKLPSSLL